MIFRDLFSLFQNTAVSDPTLWRDVSFFARLRIRCAKPFAASAATSTPIRFSVRVAKTTPRATRFGPICSEFAPIVCAAHLSKNFTPIFKFQTVAHLWIHNSSFVEFAFCFSYSVGACFRIGCTERQNLVSVCGWYRPQRHCSRWSGRLLVASCLCCGSWISRSDSVSVSAGSFHFIIRIHDFLGSEWCTSR